MSKHRANADIHVCIHMCLATHIPLLPSVYSQISVILFAGPTDMLWDHEVVELFFLSSSQSEYLELEFGPYVDF